MALDVSLGQLVLFGGFNFAHGALNDTWAWAGATWVRRTPSRSPSPRAEASMASWSAGHAIILWGGLGAPAGVLADAWKWDGSTWSPIASPGARSDAAATDAGSQVLFFGGDSQSGYHDDLWRWNGLTWS
jgi:hypothetical protein